MTDHPQRDMKREILFAFNDAAHVINHAKLTEAEKEVELEKHAKDVLSLLTAAVMEERERCVEAVVKGEVDKRLVNRTNVPFLRWHYAEMLGLNVEEK